MAEDEFEKRLQRRQAEAAAAKATAERQRREAEARRRARAVDEQNYYLKIGSHLYQTTQRYQLQVQTFATLSQSANGTRYEVRYRPNSGHAGRVALYVDLDENGDVVIHSSLAIPPRRSVPLAEVTPAVLEAAVKEFVTSAMGD